MFRRFREKLYRFMYGRYGVADDLHKFLMISFFVVWIADLITSAAIPAGKAKLIVSLSFMVISIGILSWMTYRMLSKNIYKRRKENDTYVKIRGAIKQTLFLNTSRKTKSRNEDTNEYIFRDCTNCGSTLRLPRKEGKHSVKCPRCSHSFYVISKKDKKGNK